MDTPPIADAVLVSLDTFNMRHAVATSTTLTLPVNQRQDIALASLVNVALYDMRQNRIEVLVLDEEVGSLTNGFYISASAVTTVGWKDSNNTYRIVNNYTTALTLKVNIILQHKPVTTP